MQNQKLHNFIKDVLDHMPSHWLNLTTHRLDIYNEALAKTEFTEAFDKLYHSNNITEKVLAELPTAYDYIRLGHPLSCVLEWYLAKLNDFNFKNVISFSSQSAPILAILRKNLLDKKSTLITYTGELPKHFDAELIKKVYGYHFELKHVKDSCNLPGFSGSTIFISKHKQVEAIQSNSNIDFYVHCYPNLGSVCLVNDSENNAYATDIQHVRRRETIAMTPANCVVALKAIITNSSFILSNYDEEYNKSKVTRIVSDINATTTKPLFGSSGLSVQYAIMMGLIDKALEQHPEKPIRFIVPTNCYGGTNDQARRVANCLDYVDIVDLQVDGDNDMVQSLEVVLDTIAKQNAVPYIIAEIPTNPRVEVPDLEQLELVLVKERKTTNGQTAIAPVFVLDQTFCPNLQFLAENSLLSSVKTIAYVSGSKFPSGGKCTAGYCVANSKAEALMSKIEHHLLLCDNEATAQQYKILAEQMPNILQRIKEAYDNTRDFVNYIKQTLPDAKINFVSEELATQGFTPSVFSLDLPTKGNTDEEREAYKRALNHKLITMMITKIPNESKHCVSYGQLKGCYWTIPATSTQGTTKEGDKDYIARVAVSPNLDLEKHKAVFLEFVEGV